jgi:hypothetical protein
MAVVRFSPELLAQIVFRHHPQLVTILGASTDRENGDVLIQVDGDDVPDTDEEIGYWLTNAENWAAEVTLTGRFKE